MNILEKTRNDFRNRFQFLVILTLFFPVILEALFGIGAEDINPYKTTLQWGIVISILILIYLLFEFTKRFFLKWIEEVINILILYNVFSFAVLFFILAAPEEIIHIPSIKAWGLIISFFSVMSTPVVIFLILILNFTLNSIFSGKKELK